WERLLLCGSGLPSEQLTLSSLLPLLGCHTASTISRLSLWIHNTDLRVYVSVCTENTHRTDLAQRLCFNAVTVTAKCE
ncbi:hypothetical protein FQA47_017308, partial [Oryzias melastigma]